MGKSSKLAGICCRAVLAGLLWLGSARAATDDQNDWHALVASGQLVEIKKYDRGIVVEERYATSANCMSAAIYPTDFPCLTRPETALRLHLVQQMLHNWGYRLKIWDGYRPQAAQNVLWKRWAKHGFVANPDEGPGSLHTWGLAVDATMVDLIGREVSMPSDFDVFTADASATYQGHDAKAAFHLHLLQAAMGAAGFEGLSTEWWHFVVKDWAARKPLAVPGQAGTAAPEPSDAPDFTVKSAPVAKPKATVPDR